MVVIRSKTQKQAQVERRLEYEQEEGVPSRGRPDRRESRTRPKPAPPSQPPTREQQRRARPPQQAAR
eukprot:13292424-Alexandrium_andersonii.AAC.1